MTREGWKKKITEATKAAGTYREFFDPVIATLSDILDKRDKAEKLYQESGGHAIVKHTNKSGATNLEQNPALRLINDLNRDALAYWKELGLTPAGLKKIDDKALAVKKRNALAEALRDFA